MRLSASFLAPYLQRGDLFPNLLARSVYASKYRRGTETWAETVRRCVEGNVALDPSVSEQEAEKLYHAMFSMQFVPPGRGLWTGGVEGVPVEALYNCFYCTLRTLEDWCWLADMLMCGGGVGIGLYELGGLPPVERAQASLTIGCVTSHPNVDEVRADVVGYLAAADLQVDDSREGWVEALRRTLRAAFDGRSLAIDVSAVRPRGAPIKRFGGVAPGPAPLAELLRRVWAVVRGAAGRRLSSVEALDITNFIGLCVRSGNVRRSALIALGESGDQAFRDAKKDMAAVMSHRSTSNNSIVLRTRREAEGFDYAALVDDLATMGEPGILNLSQCAPGTRGVNPCFSGDTRLATQYGLIPIRELAERGLALQVTTDARVGEDYAVQDGKGTVARDAVPAFLTSESERIFELRTRHGYRVRTTSYHKFVTPTGFVELKDLVVGDRVLLQSGEGQWGSLGNEDLGLVIGMIEGDGCLSDDRAYVRFWGDQREFASLVLPKMQALADTVPCRGLRSHYELKVTYNQINNTSQVASERVASALAEMGYREKGRVPEVVWRGTRACARGYITGLFFADGSLQWNQAKQCCSLRLSQSNLPLLEDVQTLLGNFGIVSKIYQRRDEQMRSMPDGNGCSREYLCKENFELVIESQNLVRFAEAIGFLRPDMAEKFNAWRASWKRGPYRESFDDAIVSIEEVGVEPVYCTTQPTHHTVIANGIVTGQCGEILLEDREACCLSEVFPSKRDGSLSDAELFRLAARYTLRQRLQPMVDAESDAIRRKNMRLGVGLGGVCDFEWSSDTLRSWYGYVRQEADQYADALGVARPIAVTTVKPGGTVSLVAGASPGMHAPFADYYLRRTRLADNEPMAAALVEAGVPHEPCVYDKTGHTLVFEFPCRSTYRGPTVQTESTRDQFERQLALQQAWSDNAVSATIGFDPSKAGELASLMREYVPQLKSTSCLPRDGGAYQQAPYQVIDRLEFKRRYDAIQHDHRLEVSVDDALDVGACESGACPTR